MISKKRNLNLGGPLDSGAREGGLPVQSGSLVRWAALRRCLRPELRREKLMNGDGQGRSRVNGPLNGTMSKLYDAGPLNGEHDGDTATDD